MAEHTDGDSRWLANLRVLEVDEIKTIPDTPRSHAFVERLIGTIRREFLDQTLFWGQGDLEHKLEAYQAYYNRYRCHTGLAGLTPAQRSGAPSLPTAHLDTYRWHRHCHGLFQTPELPDLQFATDKFGCAGARRFDGAARSIPTGARYGSRVRRFLRPRALRLSAFP